MPRNFPLSQTPERLAGNLFKENHGTLGTQGLELELHRFLRDGTALGHSHQRGVLSL